MVDESTIRAPALRRVHCPVLAIGGSKDVQVPVAINIPAIRAALKANPDATVEVRCPGLQPPVPDPPAPARPTSTPRSRRPSRSAALKVIGDWMVSHAR